MCDQVYVSASVCGRRKEKVLERIRAGFSGLLVVERSNLDMLHLGSARYGLL